MTRSTPPTNPSPPEQPSVIARYFLRRFALAHRKSNKLRVQFANALADTIFVFVGMPIAGITNFILVVNAKHLSPLIDQISHVAPQSAPYAFAALAMLGGYLLLNKKMKRYVAEDPTRYLQFSTEKDEQIVFWQRMGAVIILGILPTFLEIIVLVSE
jgi:hypothetical protein